MSPDKINTTIAEELDGHQPTDAEKAKYGDYVSAQLISSLIARDLENDRKGNMIADLNKKLDEMRSSCDMLGKTIKDQSDTLNNREKVVQEAEHKRDTLLQQIDDMTEGYDRLKEMHLAAIEKGGDITAQQFAEALDVYALAVARISTTDAHPQIVVALVQMAMHIRGLKNVADIITWLRGSQ